MKEYYLKNANASVDRWLRHMGSTLQTLAVESDGVYNSQDVYSMPESCIDISYESQEEKKDEESIYFSK